MTDHFERFWSTLPSPMKQGKDDARRHWSTIWRKVGSKRWLTPEGMANYMIEAVRKQVECGHFKKFKDQRPPYGSTWLHKGRYDDDLDGAAPPQPKSLFDAPGPSQATVDGAYMDKVRERYATPRPVSGENPPTPRPKEGANWDAYRAAIAVLRGRTK